MIIKIIRGVSEDHTDKGTKHARDYDTMSKMKEKCPALLHPNQLGVALPGGAEIGVHTLRQYVNHTEDKLVAKIDFRNAFNSIRRDKLLAQVK